MPSYQQALGIIPGQSSGVGCSATDCREVPDVSADANPSTGYAVYAGGSWIAIGGTSAAAPL